MERCDIEAVRSDVGREEHDLLYGGAVIGYCRAMWQETVDWDERDEDAMNAV